jgi:dTDP-4-amino-4,6-dideoxy-D-galactose acyltransferase
MESLGNIIDECLKSLFFYSPYSFIKEISNDVQTNFVKNSILESIQNNKSTHFTSNNIVFIYSYLDWDSNYFKFKNYKLQYMLYDRKTVSQSELIVATESFSKFLKDEECEYCFIEIPSEDIVSIQALNTCGFRLIETRLTYYRGNLETFSNEHYSVREANQSDITNLKEVAKTMRNDYDRFHADTIFSTELADAFLSTYIEQSIKGFVDYVMVPAEKDIPADSFLTANYFKKDWPLLDCNVSKMVLSAVSSQTNRGWYKKLISEMTYHLREQDAQYIYMNTQSTNRAVFHTWETLGYKLGATNHVLAKAFDK